jgi:alpha-L-fucosidase
MNAPEKAGREIEDTSRAELQASRRGIRAFQESRYGLSAHWGLYSLSTSGTEWTYYSDRISLDEYRRRMAEFNPVRFDADEWADLIVEAGQKFLLITSKHHDGFCLWHSEYTDFTIANTPFRRDALAELAEALRARGLGLHLYYSLVDWTHPAYRRDWPGYVDYYQSQIRELCTNYGKVAGIVFDGYWPRGQWIDEDEVAAEYFAARGPWDLAGTYDIIHELQPDAVVANNTHVLPLRGEDYQIWELDLPGENTIGFNTTEVGDKPTACWWNLNAGWSYQPWNHSVKSAESILETYRAARSRNAVFILNVGPRPFGDIHPEEQVVLRQIGQAIRRHQL